MHEYVHVVGRSYGRYCKCSEWLWL